ncbi:unnamed protein product [Toxocara canis]|uniref:PHD finger protein 10 n=1 Tax=Toxocara canis TaxID=6265 RepID=A0A183UIK4_TOXCA|nr:unnamed protein product [Toxocara canis]
MSREVMVHDACITMHRKPVVQKEMVEKRHRRELISSSSSSAGSSSEEETESKKVVIVEKGNAVRVNTSAGIASAQPAPQSLAAEANQCDVDDNGKVITANIKSNSCTNEKDSSVLQIREVAASSVASETQAFDTTAIKSPISVGSCSDKKKISTATLRTSASDGSVSVAYPITCNVTHGSMEDHASTAQANDLPLQNSVGVICAKEKLTKASSSNENSLKGLTSNENPIKVPLSNENTIQARLPNENSAEILQTIEGQISPSSEKPVKSSPPKNELKEHGAKYNNDSKVEKEKKNIAEMASFESVRDQNQKSFEAVTPERKSVEVIKPQQDMIKAFIQEEAAKKLAMLQGQIAEASTLTEKTIHETTLSKKETTELAKLQETSANNCSLEETIVRRPVLQKDDIKLYRAHCHEVVRINDTEQAIKASLQKGLNDVAKEVESVTANAVVDSKGELNTKSIFNLSKVVAVHQASATASNTSDKAAGTGAAEEKALQDKNAGSASSDKSVESGRKTTHQKNDTKVATCTQKTVVRFPNTIAARSPNDRVTMDTMQTAVRIPNTLSVGGTDKNTTTGTLQNAIESRQQGGKSEIRERIEEVTKKMEQAVESTNALCEVEENKVEPQQNIPCQKYEPGNRKLLKTGVISTRDDESPRRANQELPNKELQGGNNIAVANSQNDRSKVATARVEIDSPPEPPDVSLAKQSEGIVEGNCQAIRSEALASETSPTLPNGSKLISRSVPASHLKDYSAICGERNRADEGDEMFIADTELKHERSPSEEEEFVDAVSEVSERCSEASDHATFTLEEPALPDDLSSLDGSPDEMLVEDPPTQGMPRTLSIDTELTDSMVTLSAKGDIAAIQVCYLSLFCKKKIK